jgi:hypothetical protein
MRKGLMILHENILPCAAITVGYVRFWPIFPFTGHMLLSIAILDINDNAPVFKEAEYLARINESAAAGTFVVQVCGIAITSGLPAYVAGLAGTVG